MRQEIMVERAVPWCVNGVAQRPFLCTPEHEEELALGHLLSQGVLLGHGEARATRSASGEIQVETAAGLPLQGEDAVARLHGREALNSPLTVSREALRRECQALLEAGELFGTHRVTLMGPKGRVIREDVGRHNAVDKCAGHAFLGGWQMAECVMGCTGRVSLEMLAKAAMLGVPVFFTAKYPSDLAVQWAEKVGIAILARAHRPDAAVYGAAWRIID